MLHLSIPTPFETFNSLLLGAIKSSDSSPTIDISSEPEILQNSLRSLWAAIKEQKTYSLTVKCNSTIIKIQHADGQDLGKKVKDLPTRLSDFTSFQNLENIIFPLGRGLGYIKFSLTTSSPI